MGNVSTTAYGACLGQRLDDGVRGLPWATSRRRRTARIRHSGERRNPEECGLDSGLRRSDDRDDPARRSDYQDDPRSPARTAIPMLFDA